MENTKNKKPVVKLIKSKVFWARKFSFLLFVSKEGLFLLSSLLHWNGIMLRYLMNLQTF